MRCGEGGLAGGLSTVLAANIPTPVFLQSAGKQNYLSSPRAKRAGWPKASALASLARLLLDFIHPPPPSGAVGHNPKSGSGQFLGRTSLEMHFTRVGVKSKIGHTTRVDAYVCLTLHAGRVKRVKCVKHAILGKIRE